MKPDDPAALREALAAVPACTDPVAPSSDAHIHRSGAIAAVLAVLDRSDPAVWLRVVQADEGLPEPDLTRFSPGCGPYDHPLTCRCPFVARTDEHRSDPAAGLDVERLERAITQTDVRWSIPRDLRGEAARLIAEKYAARAATPTASPTDPYGLPTNEGRSRRLPDPKESGL